MKEIRPIVSFVVPLFNTGTALPALIEAFRTLRIDEPWELILVDDGSSDGTPQRARGLLGDLAAKVIIVELARNYGEHAAVLEGLRRATGKFMVNLDDDLQNPPTEAIRLVQHLRSTDADVVYASYDLKHHHWFRNLGSQIVNAFAGVLLNKPRGLYLSSFRAMRRELVERIVSYRGANPYIDGLILGATNRFDSLRVEHCPSLSGESRYTLRGLLRLTASVCCHSSVMPLRLTSLLGAVLSMAGGIMLTMVIAGLLRPSWGPVMSVMILLAGMIMIALGLIGEYLGRAFMMVTGSPQSLVRSVSVHEPLPQ